MALEQKLRMIHVQADPIGRYWKPERSRFEACAHGSLLILAPWPEDMPTFASDYDRFHYLNRPGRNDLCYQSYHKRGSSRLTPINFYLFPFALLCVLHSIWQFSMSVAPPLLQAVTWSASISFRSQILL